MRIQMPKYPKPELLAPAGSIDALKAGVNAGADAVYLSGKRFGARQFAANFSEREMSEAIVYAHLRGVKVFVTVNTLIKDKELLQVAKYLMKLYEIGVDAVIVQDVGLARLAKELVPDLPLHSSTQMTIHNQEGVKWAAEHGFERVVLAREMKLADIKKLAQKLKKRVELEVFVHGALCYSYSGQCLLSSFIGGRSGNRGMCAQPCRKIYQLVRGKTDLYGKPIDITELALEEDHYLLSTKDLSLYNHLNRICRASLDSIKIEGRMRSPEYVATVISVYRQTLDSICRGKWKKREKELSKLKLTFNRGFTKGYILGANYEFLMGRNSPGNRGLYLGEVIDYNQVRRETIIHMESSVKPEKGDGILFKSAKTGNLWGAVLEYSPPVENDRIFLKLRKTIKVGSKVFITRKKSLINEAQEVIKNPKLPHSLPLDVFISWNHEYTPMVRVLVKYPKGKNIDIKFKADFSMKKAIKHPLTKDIILKQLKKTGGTPFIIRKVEMEYPGDLFTSLSNLNHLRREILERVQNQILESYLPPIEEIKASKSRMSHLRGYLTSDTDHLSKDNSIPLLAIYVDRLTSLEAALEVGCQRIYFQPALYERNYYCLEHQEDYQDYFKDVNELIKDALILCNDSGSNLIWKWPEITSRSYLEGVKPFLKPLLETGISGVMVDGLGAAKAVKAKEKKMNLYGSAGLNIWNHLTVQELSPTFKSLTLSPELSLVEIKHVVENSNIRIPGKRFELMVQGNLEALVSEDCLPCVIKDKNLIDKSENEFLGIRDSKNRIFPIRLDIECRTHILNSVELCLLDHLPSILNIGFDSLVIDTRAKPAKYAKKMVSIYQQGLEKTIKKGPSLINELLNLKKKAKKISNGGITTGNFLRGVEED
jgi:U32 family peptidase